MWPRRDVLRLGALLAAGGAMTPLLAACASPAGTEIGFRRAASVARIRCLSGPITVLTDGGDPSAEPSLKRVYDDFKAQNPAIEWDIRALPGGGPDWDRLARATLTSGERGRARDDRRSAGSGMGARRSARRPGRRSGDGRRPRPGAGSLPSRRSRGGDYPSLSAGLTRGVHTTGIFYNKALLDRASLGPPTVDRGPQGDGQAALAALGVAPLVHCSGDASSTRS